MISGWSYRAEMPLAGWPPSQHGAASVRQTLTLAAHIFMADVDVAVLQQTVDIRGFVSPASDARCQQFDLWPAVTVLRER